MAYNWKTFKIDYDNVGELKILRGILNNRIQEIGNQKRKELPDPRIEKRKQLDLIEKIFNCDIKTIYLDMQLVETQKYYVYCHSNMNIPIKPRKKAKDAFAQLHFNLKYRPFYIGKGTGNRYLKKERNKTYLNYTKKLQDSDIEMKIICDNLSEIEALCLEAKLIDIFGIYQFSDKPTKNQGYLTNLDEQISPIIRKRLYPFECREYFSETVQNKLNIV